MTITLSQLESHLWESANILRGPVDAADFKSYVFPLLFFKRISDVHDDEYAVAMKAFDGDEESAMFSENYGFQIPADCHWADVRKVATNVGQALQTAMRGIEQANPHTLYGIFGDAQWTNKDRLSDALLRDLIEHFSKLSLGNSSANSDVLGQSYEYLIKKFADARDWEQFHTPKNLSMAVAGEAGELVAEFQWLTAEQSMRSNMSPEKLKDVELEIADVAIYLIRLADVLGIDVAEVVRKKIAINEFRF